MTPRFAVTAEGDDVPAAIFTTFEDAFAWGTLRFGPEAFHVDEIFTRDVGTPARRRAAAQ